MARDRTLILPDWAGEQAGRVGFTVHNRAQPAPEPDACPSL
jgi:hypothetical protein